MKCITYGSVFSGIEAATVAWKSLGFKASWLSEIDLFPSAVLDYHYPSIKNLGDMTKIAQMILDGEVEAPEILVGGSPCQAFSVAGNRLSLDDDRGLLTIKYVELANAIDVVRRRDGKSECVIVWENVPGVLNTRDNAFGCFLGELTGGGSELKPSGKRWTNAGCVFGPQRAAAWRILDAQYFGLAQRRKRVFLIASAREDICPAEILFEFDGVRRDIAPSRETGQEVTSNVRTGFTPSSFGGYRAGVGTLRANGGDLGGGSETLVTQGFRKLTFESYAQDETASTMMARDYKSYTDLVAYSFDSLSSNSMKSSNPHSGCREVNLSKTLDTTIPCPSKNQGGIGIVSEAYGIPGNWIGRKPENGGNSTQFMREVSPAQTATDKHGVVAFSCKDYGADAGPLSPTLRAMGHSGSHANGGGQVAVAFNSRQDPVSGELFGALDTGSPQAQAIAIQGTVIGRKPENGPQGPGFDDTGVCFTQTAVDRHAVAVGWNGYTTPKAMMEIAPCMRAQQGGEGYGVCFTQTSADRHAVAITCATKQQTMNTAENLASTLLANDYKEPHAVATQTAVRRLTPIECERLQGFPDNYTAIPWRNKPAEDCPDGHRYKALGNSMAVPVMKWIGSRINDYLLKI